MTKNNYITEDEYDNCFELSYSEKLYMMILIYSWYIGGEKIHISLMNKFKLVILTL